jgi:hypothetical protein
LRFGLNLTIDGDIKSFAKETDMAGSEGTTHIDPLMHGKGWLGADSSSGVTLWFQETLKHPSQFPSRASPDPVGHNYLSFVA